MMIVFVRLSVCTVRPARMYRTPHGRSFSMSVDCAVVAQFSSGGVAIRYPLPVLWMTSCFYTVGHSASCVFLNGETRERITAETTESVPNKFCSTIEISK